MAKIRLTKNELKLQRDALKRFQRYLPTLQLKKQQLQLEVRHARESMAYLEERYQREVEDHAVDLALFADFPEDCKEADKVSKWRVATRNIAGIEVPAHAGLDWERNDPDPFVTPFWIDEAVELVEQLQCLEDELRVVNQRVNLFEKVKIPAAQENIRRINIYIGDQQTNSVGRSKIAKAKCQERDADLS